MVNAEIKRELIVPSSPTPPHLKSLRLSFLDQCAPPVYIHIILYFQAPAGGEEDTGDISRRLKKSLSETLAAYYPLAGRLRTGSTSIECNDAGAEYHEARFEDRRVVEVIESSEIEELAQYVPAAPAGGGDILLAVQVSFFGDGGIAIGFCMSHRVADARSMVMFANAWAATTKKDPKRTVLTQPTFDLSRRFPPADFSTMANIGESLPLPPPQPQKIVSKRYAFDEKKLAVLKKSTSGRLLENPTRVEAVSAFIWRNLIHINNDTDKTTTFAAAQAVDIVYRASPPLPPQYFGNACARAMAMATGESPKYYDLALKFREAIGKTDGGYVRRLEDGENFLREYSVSEENDPVFRDGGKRLELCCFTSWWRLPAYEADYGWGTPEWVSIVGVPLKNLVLYLRTRTGEGIEAWMNMAEEDVAAMERNYKSLDQLEKITNGHNLDMSVIDFKVT